MFCLCALFWGVAQISVVLCKDEPNTPLTELMRKEGAKKVRAALGSYVGHLKSGEAIIQIYLTLLPVHSHISIGDSSA